MLKLVAVLHNVYKTDSYVNRETKVETPSRNKFQLMVKKPTKNGSVRQELIDISVKDEVYNKHKDSIGKTIEIDVGYFGQGITFFGI
jgi:hypothetical protein